ncbi:hypothetical protein PLICRDRAFT_227669 [Plicaturopsis crispa FD-325 SS-3]|nr:hypothetical protein PLICRDRAFT_227669 [Plicaturopsis crispa FD-325 SS-3]
MIAATDHDKTPRPSRTTSPNAGSRRPTISITVPETASPAPSIVFTRSPPKSPTLHASIAALTCLTPLGAMKSHDGSTTSAPMSSLPVSDEILAVGELLATMKQTLATLGRTFEVLGDQTEKVGQLGPTLTAAHQLGVIRTQLAEQFVTQDQRIEKVKELVSDRLKKDLEEHLRDRIQPMINGAIEEVVQERVKEQLEARIPATFRQLPKSNKRQTLSVQTSLHNSEARRHNGLLTAASMNQPLRPLLRPYPIQSPLQGPSNLLKPTIKVSSPTDVPPTPAIPSPPAPTPIAEVDGDTDDTPTPSPFFPRDLASLFALGPDSARLLVQEYGLIDQGQSPVEERQNISAARTPSTPGSGDSREANLNRFMAHIGVPFKMVPAPASSPGSPSLVIST